MFIDLSTFIRVKEFTNTILNKTCKCYLKSENYVINAKSVIGIFSLDLSKPVFLEVEDNDYSNFEYFKA